MSSLLKDFEYDIFISYRHNDNLDGWVTDFAQNLEKELRSTIKEPLSIYFDRNPYDGLLETHHVDKSLEGKLKCLIFIPIISQTYCDSKSFAWQYEFCAFNRLAQEDALGRDIKLSNGNVASRILPVKIHDLDAEDQTIIESETGGVLRAIEFIYKEPGVNRPLLFLDQKSENQNKTDYRNQVNKVANAIKDLVYSISGKLPIVQENVSKRGVQDSFYKKKVAILGTVFMVALFTALSFFYFKSEATNQNEAVNEILDRAEKYIDEAARFGDVRYFHNAHDAIQKAIAMDSLNERALYMMATFAPAADTSEYYIRKILNHNPNSSYGLIARALRHSEKRLYDKAKVDLEKVLSTEPESKDALRLLSDIYSMTGDYVSAWQYAKRYERVSGKKVYSFFSEIYMELGDFKEAKRQLDLKLKAEELSCNDLETSQRIFLCEGNFERLEQVTDSICELTKCDKCPYWKLRAKMHAGKYEEAAQYTKGALKNYGPIAWRLPAFVLHKVGKADSAKLIMDEEVKYDTGRLADTTYRQAMPLYSLSAIHALQGDNNESIKWLKQYADKGFVMGSEWYIVNDPLFEGLKQDPRYFPEFMQIVNRAQNRKLALREKIRELENTLKN